MTWTETIDEQSSERAVKRVYHELRARNDPDLAAFDTAVNVYRIHHPQVVPKEAVFAASVLSAVAGVIAPWRAGRLRGGDETSG